MLESMIIMNYASRTEVYTTNLVSPRSNLNVDLYAQDDLIDGKSKAVRLKLESPPPS